jgi:predicted MFS family arabinose efflux permease
MKTQTKLFNATYLLLILVNLVTAFGFSMIATLISSYALTLGAGLTLAGTMAGIFSLAALCIRPFSGMAVDILNKRNMCIFSTILICISFLGYAMAASVPVMFIFRILHGVAFGISGTANMVLVSEYIPQERLGEGLGYFGLGQIFAQICGPNVGIAIKDHFGYQNLFLIISLLTLLAVAILFLVKEKAHGAGKPKNVKTAFRFQNLVAKECIVYAMVAGLFSLGNGITSSFLVLLGENRGINNIALFFTVNALILLVMRLMIGRVVDKSGLTLIVILSLLLTAASMFTLGKATGLVLILVAAVFKAVGQGGGQISLQSACIKKVDVGRVGIATSTYYIGADIGQGFGPILGGKLSDLFSYEIMFYCMAMFMLAGIVVFCFYQRRENGRVVTN